MDLSRRFKVLTRLQQDRSAGKARGGGTGQGCRRKQGARIDGARRLGQRQDLLVAGPLALEDDRALDEVNDRVEEVDDVRARQHPPDERVAPAHVREFMREHRPQFIR